MNQPSFPDSTWLDSLLSRLPGLHIGVAGDFFLDRYFDVDPQLAEVSVETGLTAHQAVAVRCSPGAAANVANNLAALGVGTVHAIGAYGDDGEGYELARALSAAGVNLEAFARTLELRTPTYNKTLILAPGAPPRELERIDIKNRRPLPRGVEHQFLDTLNDLLPRLDGLLICDQVDEENCGMITETARARLNEWAAIHPAKPILADSRARIGRFQNMILKPNRREALALAKLNESEARSESALATAGARLAQRTGRPVFITLDADGLWAFHGGQSEHVAAYRTSKPIDTVGAGDCVAAAIVAALAAGEDFRRAAFFGNLAASISVEQIGVTGTASPGALRGRLEQYLRQF